MTVDELILKLRRVDFDTIERDLYALLYTESERAAAIVHKRGCERNLIGTGAIADEILATSPSKGGG